MMTAHLEIESAILKRPPAERVSLAKRFQERVDGVANNDHNLTGQVEEVESSTASGIKPQDRSEMINPALFYDLRRHGLSGRVLQVVPANAAITIPPPLFGLPCKNGTRKSNFMKLLLAQFAQLVQKPGDEADRN